MGCTRRTLLSYALMSGSYIAVSSTNGTVARPTAQECFRLIRAGKKVPVIFDTDIGDDIDDTWALTMLLKSPELDVKLVVADGKNTIYRARLIAKLLTVAGRTDVPVGVGPNKDDRPGRQSQWVGDFKLSDYGGSVYEDGVKAIADVIRSSRLPVTLICTGPVPNIKKLLQRFPWVTQKARFVGMHGSIRLGYGGRPKPAAEYNVRAAPDALQAVFEANWEVTITPLDTCGLVHLDGERYQRVLASQDPLVQALIENYRVWARGRKGIDPSRRSTTLFDTVAIYLAYSEELLEIEGLPLRVTEHGMTVIDRTRGRTVRCATRWKNYEAYLDHLVERLTG